MNEQPKRYRVLVVDDDTLMLRIMSAVLSQDMDVVTTTSGERALRLLDTNDVHVVCADYQMPGMSGVELIRKVSTIRPNTGCILVTGSGEYARSEERKEYYVMLKPFQPPKLLSLVKQIASIAEMKRSVGASVRDAGGSPEAPHDVPRSRRGSR